MMTTRSPLPHVWEVPAVFRERLRETIGKQRAMQADGHLLLVLHAPPQANDSQRVPRFFWRSADGAWRSTTGGGIAALQNHVAEYDEAIGKLDEAEDHADRAHDFLDILLKIAPLRRSARNLYETLQEARDLVHEDSELIACRDLAYNVQRRADLVQSDTQNGLQCAMARRAEEQADTSYRMALSAHRLNLLAAVFFPLATIGAVFGMNVPHGFENGVTGPWFFWLIVLAGIAAGFLLKGLVDSSPTTRK